MNSVITFLFSSVPPAPGFSLLSVFLPLSVFSVSPTLSKLLGISPVPLALPYSIQFNYLHTLPYSARQTTENSHSEHLCQTLSPFSCWIQKLSAWRWSNTIKNLFRSREYPHRKENKKGIKHGFRRLQWRALLHLDEFKPWHHDCWWIYSEAEITTRNLKFTATFRTGTTPLHLGCESQPYTLPLLEGRGTPWVKGI